MINSRLREASLINFSPNLAIFDKSDNMPQKQPQAENYTSGSNNYVRHSKKKPAFPISKEFHAYLEEFNRVERIPIRYNDLLEWYESIPIYDKDGNDTLWRSVIYAQHQQDEIYRGLTEIYGLLKTGGNMEVIEHLTVAQIDYCQFGNSNPFRVKIRNTFNDVHDYFYVKKVDASRVYGMELEHILSPNRIFYIIDEDTIIKEHIMGIPCDVFINTRLSNPDYQEVPLAKEFVKFNERCFVLLLGDMRSYNYVINITPDFDKRQYRARCIDFDQFCYEGRRNNYLPQFYKENNPIVAFCSKVLPPETIYQYQYEERSLIKKRYQVAKYRLHKLLDAMHEDVLSTPDKIASLAEDMNLYHHTREFERMDTMGKILRLHLKLMFDKPRLEVQGKVTFKPEVKS